MPPAGIAVRRLAAALAAHAPTVDVHPSLDPLRLGVSVPQAAAMLARPSGRRPSSRPAATSRSRVLLAAAPLRIPVVLWEGNVDPRAQRPRDGPPGRRRSRSPSRRPAPRSGAAPGAVLPHRDADPRHARDRPRRGARRAWASAAGERVLLVFGGSQAVRRFNAAVSVALPAPRRARHGHPRDRRRRLCRGARGPRGAADRAARPLPAVPVPARRDAGRAGRRRPGRRAGRLLDAGRGRRALGVPMVVVPYPHAAGHQRANARVLVDAGRRGSWTTRRSMRRPCSTRPSSSTIRPRHVAMSAAARSLGRPGAADAVARPRDGRRRAPAAAGPPTDDRPRDRAGARPRERRHVRRHRRRDRDPAPDRGQDLARRAARAVHDDARRRPGRPVRRRSTTRSSCARLVRFARSREHAALRARAGRATWSSATPGSAASSSRTGPRVPGSTASASPPRRGCRWPAPRPRRSAPA